MVVGGDLVELRLRADRDALGRGGRRVQLGGFGGRYRQTESVSKGVGRPPNLRRSGEQSPFPLIL